VIFFGGKRILTRGMKTGVSEWDGTPSIKLGAFGMELCTPGMKPGGRNGVKLLTPGIKPGVFGME